MEIYESSETDSSDEDKRRLREAVDSDFINDSMFGSSLNGDNCNNAVTQKTEKPAAMSSLISLRDANNDYQQYNDLRVTPEFQKYIAKHLEKILDSQLREKRKKAKPHIHQEPAGGVKLFTDSPVYLSSTEESVVNKKRAKIGKRKRNHSSSSENSEAERERFAEAAVTPDWVLTQEGTKGWTQSFKGEKIVINSQGEIVKDEKPFK